MGPLTCGGCDETWGGLGRSHCSGCHRTFSTPGLFDRHRSRGCCMDPARLTNSSGERVLFLRDGIWAGPPMTDAQKAARFTPDL